MKQYYIASHHEKKNIAQAIFFEKKRIFGPFSAFSAKRKNGRFSVIPAWTGSVVIVGNFLVTRMVPTIFVKDGPKLWALI